MTSIIKVDQIQTTAGTAPTAADLGMNVSGNVLQVVSQEVISYTAVASATSKIVYASLTTKAANSKFLIQGQVNTRGVSSYQDIDLALAMGYKTGSGSSSSTDYTGIHPYNFTRENVAGLNAYLSFDTHPNGAQGDQYSFNPHPYQKLISPNIAAGQLMDFAIFASTANGTWVFGQSTSSSVDIGYFQHLTVYEIAG